MGSEGGGVEQAAPPNTWALMDLELGQSNNILFLNVLRRKYEITLNEVAL